MARATKKPIEQDTEGAQPGAQVPGAPISEPAGTSASALAGEAAAGLPGSDPDARGVTADPVDVHIPADEDIEIIGIDLATPEPAEPATSGNSPLPDDGAGGDGGLGMASEITVICHADGGRRRLGRRWKNGATVIPAVDLDDFSLQTLRGDPQFTVLIGEG